MFDAKKLKRLRTSRKMSQESLANLVGVTKYAISHYENKRRTPSIDIVKKFSDIFDVSVSEFIK